MCKCDKHQINFLYLQLSIQDGYREHIHRVLHTTKAKNIHFAAERYAARYWSRGRVEGRKSWMQCNGEIAVRLEKVTRLTKREYELMYDVMYN